VRYCVILKGQIRVKLVRKIRILWKEKEKKKQRENIVKVKTQL